MAEPGQKFAELLRTLVDHDVRFVVVGAVAAVLEGAPLTTFDLDVVVETSDENLNRLLGALNEIDAVYWDPARRRIVPDAGRLRVQRLHLLETRFGRLDLLQEIGAGFGWEEVFSRSHECLTAGRAFRVLDLAAVIESKEAAGRDKDLAALPLLRETLRLKRDKERA